MPPVSGFKTSEFITSLVPIVLGFLLVIFGLYRGQKEIVDTGMILLLGGTTGYGVSRGLAKLGAGIGGPLPTNEVEAAKVLSGVK